MFRLFRHKFDIDTNLISSAKYNFDQTSAISMTMTKDEKTAPKYPSFLSANVPGISSTRDIKSDL